MPTFRNVNSGQVVQVEDDPSHLDGLARWVRDEDGLSAPEDQVEPDTAVGLDAALDAAQSELVTTPVRDNAVPKPGPEGDREDWIAYALDNGKTRAELKGVKTTVIASWFE
ncbi:hypothetical protein [Rhodococcoides fascians]|uniref:hypothetical protein n=1 Tax=Rhodococcoides fascians TaxID=1828 RepID=UPI00050CCC2E|nr:hypothetical protein [Rhodococcus fascians]